MDNEKSITSTLSTSATLMKDVYWWMCAGLGLTGLTALLLAGNPAMVINIFQSGPAMIGIVLAELALVFVLSGAIDRLSFGSAALLYSIYAVLNGVTMSAVLLVYTGASVASTFFITAGMFAGMAVYGSVTKRDLSAWGRMLIMILIGVLIASVVNIFLRSTGLYWLLTIGGVVLFAALTAYDTQKIRNMATMMDLDDERGQKFALLGALTLYLDFVNLFLYLIRLFGKRN